MARLEGLTGGSAPGESRARLGLAHGLMTAQADHGQLCSASLGTRPVSSGRDLVHAWRLEHPRPVLILVDADLAPRGENRFVGLASRLSQSRAVVQLCVSVRTLYCCPIESSWRCF